MTSAATTAACRTGAGCTKTAGLNAILFSRLPFPNHRSGGVNSSSEGLSRDALSLPKCSGATLKIRAVPEQPRIALTLQDLMSVPVLQCEAAGFTIADSLAAINSVTRLNGVHFHYSSHLRSFCTLHNSLPPYATKLLDSRTGIRETPGISPGGFIFIYTRLVAYRQVVRGVSR